MIRSSAAAFGVLLALPACEEPERSADPVKPATATKQAVRPDACAALREQARELLVDKSAGRCDRDTDCVCYPAAATCGGVTDAKTARRLHTLARMFRLARCKSARCEPVQCAPRCVAGRCVASGSASRAERETLWYRDNNGAARSSTGFVAEYYGAR